MSCGASNDEQFLTWLAWQRQAFEDQVDRDVEAWRRSSRLPSDF
jgi:hypothetical protein